MGRAKREKCAEKRKGARDAIVNAVEAKEWRIVLAKAEGDGSCC